MDRIEITKIGTMLVGSPENGHAWVDVYCADNHVQAKKLFDEMQKVYEINSRLERVRDMINELANV
jgi:hypothetical protein